MLLLGLAPPALASELTLQETWPPASATDVPIDTSIRLHFSEPPDPTSVTAESVQILRSDTGAALPATITFEGASVILKPEMRFYAREHYPQWEGVEWSGLKPDGSYTVRIAASVRDREGHTLSAPQEIPFSTTPLDWGIYWLDADARMEKHHAGISPTYYDPERPAVVYIHGWQSGTSMADFRRENPFFYNSKYFEFHNALPDWKARGFNVGILYWSQWADEPEVRDAEAKVWFGRNGQRTKDGKTANMRFRTRDGSWKDFPTDRSIADLAFETYSEVFGNYAGPGIRIVGHSLGNQLAVSLSKQASDAVKAHRLTQEALPTRLTLLDPFWSKGGKPFLQGKSPGEVCTNAVRELAANGMAIDVYKSSPVGGIVGDENVELRKHVAFARLWPDFIPITDAMYQHVFGYIWFAKSIVAPIPAGEAALGSGATDADIRMLMNDESRAPLRMFFTGGEGTHTVDTRDDRFQVKAGTGTW